MPKLNENSKVEKGIEIEHVAITTRGIVSTMLLSAVCPVLSRTPASAGLGLTSSNK